MCRSTHYHGSGRRLRARPASPKRGSNARSPHAMNGAILVVEDEPITQRLIAANLERAGHRVMRAANEIGRASLGKECRSRCDWSSDVCSSDLAMNGAILVVEDEPITQRLIAANLERAGHRVMRAAN